MSDSSGDVGSSTFSQGDQQTPRSDFNASDGAPTRRIRGTTSRSNQKSTPFEPANLASNTFPIDFGDYRLIRKIGEGGMGVVYEAEQKSMGNRRLALKTIKYVGGTSDRALKRFKNEVQAVAQLEHRHIVPVYQLGEESGVHFYVMKLIEGNNLRELVNTLKTAVSRRKGGTEPSSDSNQAGSKDGDSTHKSGWSKGDTLASNDVLDRVSRDGTTAHPQFIRSLVRIGIQIANALHHVHQQGVVHRDIKPANLLLDVEGDLWLTDFGLAMIRDNPSLTAPGDLVGTYHYMSPEQAMGSKRVIVDHRSDIYSLGVTLYELLTLKRAYPGRSREQVLRSVQFDNPLPVRKIAPGVPADLETIVMKAMAKDPNARFQSAAELATELQRFLDGKPLTIRPPGVLERFGYWARANRQKVATLAAMCAITFLAAIVIAIVSLRANAQTHLALQAETNLRIETERLLKRSEGLRLAANSALQVDTDPTLALLLASEAAELHPGADANDAILRAMDVGHEARILQGHTVPVGHVAFNHDGTRLVSSASEASFGQGSEPAIVWDSVTGKELGRLQGDKTITSSVYSPDKFRILTASSPPEKEATNDIDDSLPAATPYLWDATTFQVLVPLKDAFLFKAHPRAFSPDGRRVVAPVKGNKASTFDCVSGASLVEFSGHEARVVFAAFNMRGDRVVTYSDDNTVRIWDSQSGVELLKLDHWKTPGLERQVREPLWIEFSSDGRRLVTTSQTRGVLLFDLEKNGELINSERIPGSAGMLYGNGDLLATHGGEDLATMQRLAIRSAYDARPLGDLQTNQLLRKVVISPDNQVAGVLHWDYLPRFQIWDLARSELRASFGGGTNVINDLTFSPDSKLIATASQDKKVRLWHVSSGRDRATYPTTTQVGHPIVAASPDGTTLSIASAESAAVGVLCDFEASEQAFSVEAKLLFPSHGGQRFLAIGDGRLALHSMEDGSFLGKEAFVHGDAQEAAINRDGDRIAVFLGGTDVILWMPDTNRRMLLPTGPSQVNGLSFSPDGKKLFTLSSDGKIRVWDAESGNLIRSLGNGGRLFHIDFSPDASQFVVTTSTNEATLYDAGSFEELWRLSDPSAEFDHVRFTFDGKKLVAYSFLRSKSVTLWDIDSRSLLPNNLPVEGNVGVVMHPSQPEALVWSEKEGAVIWRYDENQRLPVTDVPTRSGAFSHDGRSLYLATWAPAFYEAPNLEDFPTDIDTPKVTRWVREGLQAQESIEFPLEAIHQILVTDQDQVFVNALRRNQVVNYDIASHEPLSTISGHFALISECLYTSDSKRLITTSWDGRVSTWSVADGQLLTTRSVNQSPILVAALSVGDRYLVTGHRDGSCLVSNLVDGTVADSVKLGDSPIRHLALDGDAKHVLAVTSDNKSHLFQRATGEVVPLDFHSESIEWAEFSPDGTSILVIPRELEAQDPPSTVLIVPIDGTAVTKHEYAAAVQTSHFHPDSKRIVTTTKDGIVSIQNARSGRVEHALQHESVFGAVFDPTGEYVYVSEFNAGTIWRISEDEARKWLTVEDRSVDHAWRHTQTPFLSGQPRRGVTRRFDKIQYRDWHLNPLEAAQDQLPRSFTEAERNRFLIEEK